MVALVALAAAALAALGTWVVLGSDLLAVHDVRVEGVSSIPADRVRAVADVPVGTPLARVDVDAVVARVAALPEVAGVEVRRGWPRSLVVVVREREPVAVVAERAAGSAAADPAADPGGSAAATSAAATPAASPAASPAAGDGGWLVDATGVAYRRVDRVPAGLPWITADEGPARQAAAAVVAGLPDKIARRVIAASATTRDDVTLTLRSGAEVRWGSAEQPELKAEVLRALLRQDATWYDVSAPELPTTRG
ncbi:MAG: FtsQ-type POTRA domain-containing protein [Candidatus Nanopelagicales bacterium]